MPGPRFIIAAFVLVIMSSAAIAQDFKKSIMTGGASGTYIQIGRDVAAVGTECGIALDVVESAGSLENLVAVKRRSNTQFGIVQSDVLEYVRSYATDDPELQRSLYGVRIMYPLYNEEVQVLATREITRLSDLSGKKVAVGKADSGTFLTATLILDILRIDDAQRLKVGASDALEMLLDGQIDALFYVAGAPTKLFSNIDIDGSRYHLVDIMEPELQATYTTAEIPGGTYPFQPDPVNVVAVKAVLMTYDYKPQKNAYHRESCKAVSDVSSLILTNFERLKASGHPKWRNVDFSQLPPGWRVGECVKVGMQPRYKLTCTPSAGTLRQSAETDEEYLNLLKSRLQN